MVLLTRPCGFDRRVSSKKSHGHPVGGNDVIFKLLSQYVATLSSISSIKRNDERQKRTRASQTIKETGRHEAASPKNHPSHESQDHRG